jgi:hypothetical protein
MADDPVGYGRPSAHARFKPGQSGNPKGRPKRTKNLRTDLLEELGESVRIREGDREYRVSKQRALIKAMVARAVKGDARAATAIVALCARLLGVGDEGEEQPLSAPDQRVIDEFVEREMARRKREPVEPRKRSHKGSKEDGA